MIATLSTAAHVRMAGAIAARSGWNGCPADLETSPAAALYVRQARDIIEDLRIPSIDVVRTAWCAIRDHVLFDSPKQDVVRPTDDPACEALLRAVLGAHGEMIGFYLTRPPGHRL